MAKRVTIKTYPTADQKAKIEPAAFRTGLSVSAYLFKAGTRDTPLPRAKAYVRMLSLLENGVQALGQVAAMAEAGGDVQAMLILWRLGGLAAQLGEISISGISVPLPVAVLPRPGRSTDMLRVTLGDECHHVDRKGVVRTLREGSNFGALDDAILRCALAFRTGPDGPGPEDEMAFGSFQTL